MILVTVKRMISARLLLWLGGMAMLVLMGCNNEPSESSNVLVSTSVAKHMKLTLQDVPTHYTTSGSVTSDHRVSISTRLSGYIRDIAVREGDSVKEGETLLHVDSVHAKQALIQANADLSNAKADMLRYASLLKEGAVTSQQVDKVKLRYEVAKSQVKQAKHQLSYAEISSPVTGVVVEKRMSQGDLASPGMTILTLEDPSSLLVKTYVSEQFVGQIHDGDNVDIEIASLKKHFKGIVRQVVQAADPVSHQFMVKISLPSVEDIHPGMYAQTGFQTGTRKALLLPEEAILLQAGLHAVYVMDAAYIAHYRLVRVGQKNQGMIEILSGLHDGDHVIWGATPALRTGMKVQL